MTQPSKTFKALAYMSLVPLLLTLLLALYHHLDWASFTGVKLSFAHINAYIYTHSYAALLLALFAGIQIGAVLNQKHHSGYVAFNFLIIVVAWLSYQSYADFLGISLLLFCWLTALALDWHAHNQNILPPWYTRLKLKLNLTVMLLLAALLAVNG